MALNRDQLRALRLLATAPNGATEAIMLAHGFGVEMLAVLGHDGLVTVEHRAMRAGRQPIRVTWLAITEAGRQAVISEPPAALSANRDGTVARKCRPDRHKLCFVCSSRIFCMMLLSFCASSAISF
jgi:hypothetical protein